MARPAGSAGPLARSVAALLAGALVLATGACTTHRYWGGSAVAGGGHAKIGLVTKTDSNPYFVELRKAAAAEAKKEGAGFVALAGKFDGDNEGQVTAIENFIQQGVTTILITPNNSTGVLSAVKQARDKGILVIALDTATEPASAVDATFATDNTAAGRQQGAYVRAALAGRAPRLLMLDGTAGSTVDTQRHTGFLSGIGLHDGDPAILGHQAANGDQNTAQQATENLLQRSTGVNAVYTMNEPTGRGAYAALSGRGLAGPVVVGSIDGGCEGVRNVKAGLFAVTVMQFPRKMAADGVAAGVAYARHGTRPKGFHNTGSTVITDRPVAGVPGRDTAWGLQNCWG